MSELFVETNFFEQPSEPSHVEDKHGKVSSPCLQRLPLSSNHNSATTSHNPAKVTILKKLHFNRISVSLFGCYFSARRQVWRVLANVCYFSRTLVAGRWVDGEGEGEVDGEDRFNIIIIPPSSSNPASPHHPTTSQFSCCAALSSGVIPSHQTKCIRTFSLQIWKFLWPLCLKFWFQSSKQWPTSCSKGCCHQQKCENSNMSNCHQRWRPCEGTGTWERYVCVSFVAPLPPPPYWVKHQAGNISKCRAPLICRSGKDGCWGAVSWARHGPGKLLLSYRCLVLHGMVGFGMVLYCTS